MANEVYFGIDLGTTNSCIAVAAANRDGTDIGKVQILETKRMIGITQGGTPEIQSKALLPSCVYYREKHDGSGKFDIIVGEFAKKHYEIRPDFVAKSIKSQMGNPGISNLSSAIPDSTPEDVSSRILKSILDSIKTQLKHEIHDAVITVPASFSFAQREATLRAAEKAGICTTNSDGSPREILLSEPEAVIYNLINEAKNNMLLSDGVLDFSRKLNILVFDIGGGTLDITFHQVERSKTNENRYIVSTDATNRYTRLAGDDFDRAIAEKMFERYLESKSVVDEAKPEIKSKMESFILKLMASAEKLKMDINEAVRAQSDDGFDSIWGYGEEESIDDQLFDTGGLQKEKYSYYDSFKKKDIEDILEKYMGRKFVYDDYKKVDKLRAPEEQQNIIYPILYVLNQASKNLQTEDIKVDAVILNGGMSRFYMIKDRIRDFFGFEPLCVTDPDLSVARGAAIYRFYKREEMPVAKEFRTRTMSSPASRPSIFENKGFYPDENKEKSSQNSGIYSGVIRNTQSLYISTSYGNKVPVIETGEKLPYSSPAVSGFIIEKNQNKIQIPICEKDEHGNFKVIATGVGTCRRVSHDTYVSVVFNLNRNKVLTFDGKRSTDYEGIAVIENISINIDFSKPSVVKNRQNKLSAPSGMVLNVNDMLYNLESANKSVNKEKAKRLKEQIIGAANKEEFAQPIIECINTSKNNYFVIGLLMIARRLSESWSDNEVKSLRKSCCSIINNYCNMLQVYGSISRKENIILVNQALLTLGAIGVGENDSILRKTDMLKDKSEFIHASLNFYANIQINTKWIRSCFKNALKNGKHIQPSVWAVGIAFRRNGNVILNNPKELISDIINIIDTSNNENVINTSVMALGLICDQRSTSDAITDTGCIISALNVLEEISEKYEKKMFLNTAYKMVKGIELNISEQMFLMKYLNPDVLFTET
ncbi:MAG: Hsp70 family protein [Oscillospiraceae bacterium]